jgi:segregation and condensation protein B
VPIPSDDATSRDDEDPLEPGDLDLGLAPAPTAELDLEPPQAVEAAAPEEAAAEDAAPEQGEPEGEK